MTINDYLHHAVVAAEYLDHYGHVNHAHYLTLFENARWGYYHLKNITAESIKEGGIGPVVLKAEISYKKEVLGGEKITIRSEHLGYRHGLWHLKQVLIKENGKVGAVVTLAFGLFDLQQRKLIAPFGQWLEGPLEEIVDGPQTEA